jgi:hypothetical protein
MKRSLDYKGTATTKPSQSSVLEQAWRRRKVAPMRTTLMALLALDVCLPLAAVVLGQTDLAEDKKSLIADPVVEKAIRLELLGDFQQDSPRGLWKKSPSLI